MSGFLPGITNYRYQKVQIILKNNSKPLMGLDLSSKLEGKILLKIDEKLIS
jgi:hypothetical protein